MEEKNNAEAVSTQMDDAANVGQTEQELLDAVMKNSDFLKNEEPPLPVEEVPEVDPTETDTEEEDPVESEEVVKEEVEEEEVEEEESRQMRMPLKKPLPKKLMSMNWMI